eukprot:12587923-Ditylum_brightwellii.AAC.1
MKLSDICVENYCKVAPFFCYQAVRCNSDSLIIESVDPICSINVFLEQSANIGALQTSKDPKLMVVVNLAVAGR